MHQTEAHEPFLVLYPQVKEHHPLKKLKNLPVQAKNYMCQSLLFPRQKADAFSLETSL